MHPTERFAAAARTVAAEPGSIAWLDAGPHATIGSSYLIVPGAVEERLVANERTGRIVETGRQSNARVGDVFSRLRERWQLDRAGEEQPRFSGGWVGWFGYECARATLDIDLPTEDEDYPDAAWFEAGAWARLDHDTGVISVDGPDAVAVRRLEVALQRAHAVPDAADAAASGGARWRDSDADYAEHVRAAQRLIADGEAYQLCLTSRISGPQLHDPLDVFLRLRAVAGSHHGSLIRIGDTALVSVSPEQFIEITPAGRIRTKPIKGTRKRSAEPDADAALAAELLASDKERAENVMIVDLMRNDLGRVAVTGSVSVPALLEVETYAPVHQLVSTIEARLAPERHPLDVVTVSFPAGSMTGAPKHRAVQHLSRLESGPRGIYSGAHGYLSNDGSIDLAMTIRSIVIRPDGWSIGAGGGITALSDPDDEVFEARLKAAALLRALGIASAD
ncbi:MAG TPA: anthranilate synthase component I family protein [Microbacteriaceae bacterium]|nr:anthranilate synthase component I family protein [Microbacteriaceae bacterium]